MPTRPFALSMESQRNRRRGPTQWLPHGSNKLLPAARTDESEGEDWAAADPRRRDGPTADPRGRATEPVRVNAAIAPPVSLRLPKETGVESTALDS
jgi:hypothetical protein